jgi:hypothetical protein
LFFDTGSGTEAAIPFTLLVDQIRILKKQRYLLAKGMHILGQMRA